MCACFGGTRVLCACESILVARRLKRRSDVAPVFKMFLSPGFASFMENFCADALFKDENWGKRQPWHHFGTISSAFLSPIPRPHAVLCNLPRVHACWTLIFCLRSDVVLIQASGTSSPPTRWGPHSGSTHSSDPPTRATHPHRYHHPPVPPTPQHGRGIGMTPPRMPCGSVATGWLCRNPGPKSGLG